MRANARHNRKKSVGLCPESAGILPRDGADLREPGVLGAEAHDELALIRRHRAGLVACGPRNVLTIVASRQPRCSNHLSNAGCVVRQDSVN